MGFEALFGGNPQQQGTLAAIAQILQASGPQRTPQSLYSILGGGMMAGQQATQQAREQSQVTELRDFAIRDKRSDVEAQEAQRKRAQALLELNSSYWKRGAQPGAAPAFPGGQSADAVFRGAMSGQEAAPQQPAAPTPTGGGLDRGAMTQQRLAYAQHLRQNGFGTEAQAEEDSALKLQPKVKGWEKVQQDGKVMFAPFFEDGTSGQPVPLEVAEKLDSINRGGSTELVNSFTGATVRSLSNSVSPDAALSAATQRRGQDITARGQNMTDARARQLLDHQKQFAKAPTEFQGKSAAFGLRATEADKIINSLSGKYDPAAVNTKTNVENWPLVGGMLGAATNRFALKANDQKAEQAQRDFVNAVLRQESGAAIGADEFDNARKQYFPQPGDGPGVIAQKARNRQLAIQGFQSNAGRAAMTAPAVASGTPGDITDLLNKYGGN